MDDQTILVKPIKMQNKTSSGIYIPESVVADSQYHSMLGELIKVAPDAFVTNSSGRPWPTNNIPKIGDVIVFARYEGTIIIGDDGKEYRILEDKTINMHYPPSEQYLKIKEQKEKEILAERTKIEDEYKKLREEKC